MLTPPSAARVQRFPLVVQNGGLGASTLLCWDTEGGALTLGTRIVFSPCGTVGAFAHTATQLFNWLSASGTITSNPSTYMALQHSASGLCVWGQTSSTNICETLLSGAPLVLTACPSTTAVVRICGFFGYGEYAAGSMLLANQSLYVTAGNVSLPTIAALSGTLSIPSYSQRFLATCMTTGPCAIDTYADGLGGCLPCPAGTTTGGATGATSAAGCSVPLRVTSCLDTTWSSNGIISNTSFSSFPFGTNGGNKGCVQRRRAAAATLRRRARRADAAATHPPPAQVPDARVQRRQLPVQHAVRGRRHVLPHQRRRHIRRAVGQRRGVPHWPAAAGVCRRQRQRARRVRPATARHARADAPPPPLPPPPPPPRAPLSASPSPPPTAR
jgi:hypothetical protein